MSSIREEVDKLGKNITKDAKQGALKNKKTGALDSSFNYEYSFISNEKFNIVIYEKFYGKYLNKKIGYMDKAIEKNLDKGVESITNVMADEFLNEISNKLK